MKGVAYFLAILQFGGRFLSLVSDAVGAHLSQVTAWQNSRRFKHILSGDYKLMDIETISPLRDPVEMTDSQWVKHPRFGLSVLTDSGRNHFSGLGSSVMGEFLQSRPDRQPIYTMELPWAILNPAAKGETGCRTLVVPAGFTSSVHCELVCSSDVVGGFVTPVAPAAIDEDHDRKKMWYERGRDWKLDGKHDQWGPLFHIQAVKLAYMLSAMNDIQQCVETVADMICPEKDVRNSMKIPLGETV
eukprot:1998137-Pyramimonas_sp.AAC.1